MAVRTRQNVRFLQFVHERPLHLFILAEDLGDFDHVHPEQVLGTSYNVTHVFPYGGRYRLYADYTPPGSAKVVEPFPLNVPGKARPPERLKPDQLLTKVADGLRATLTLDRPLRAGEHLQITCLVAIASTGLPAGRPASRAGRKQVK